MESGDRDSDSDGELSEEGDSTRGGTDSGVCLSNRSVGYDYV